MCGSDLALPESAKSLKRPEEIFYMLMQKKKNVQGYFLSPLAVTIGSQNPGGSREDRGQPCIFNEVEHNC